MKVLFIGGTGNISTATSRLAVEKGIDLYVLNRGKSPLTVEGSKSIIGDINAPEQLVSVLAGHQWDVVVNWIAFTKEEIERDIKLFAGKTRQYIFISSASAYQKPATHYLITESTPLFNPFWQYSRDKIACEDALTLAYREQGFPITIVRPSHTYDTVIPVALGGWTEYNIVDRLRKGKKIVVHGDGTSLWTLTHSDDFALGFVGLLGHPKAVGHAFHITSDDVLSWNQVYEGLADAVGVAPNFVHIPSDFICQHWPDQTGNLLGDKAHSAVFDNTKIKTFVPAFKATIPFHQGIRRTLAWLEGDASRKVINPDTEKELDKLIEKYERQR
ncbi:MULTISPECIES: SDR family oxidoreductase [unclassified Imperialibacter]|uniref:SDR family oxidoreductase n=1 Tax=unclassified Imperialibacter TaxID=2629706 RepID=UPI001252E2FE|nr:MULTISPECIES: SDR family oxidoreductase [unclassified Imperialibacter]CAD5277323.1 NAD-dependent dehydratase [Imperialibacter sp. 75]CAD5295278.1 NAD-dependent dehydratase [Imperialibacter sp. 89]VVT12154.1 NAD-dependent dehydratase [Imperialibacter sp. EC-SDR9]